MLRANAAACCCAALYEMGVGQSSSRKFTDCDVVGCRAQVALTLVLADLALVATQHAATNGLPSFDAKKKVKIGKQDLVR